MSLSEAHQRHPVQSHVTARWFTWSVIASAAFLTAALVSYLVG